MIKLLIFLLVAMMLTSGCTAERYSRLKTKTTVAEDEVVQTYDGVSISARPISVKNRAFWANVQVCDSIGRPLVNGSGDPIVKSMKLIPSRTRAYEIKIINSTPHVLRFTKSALRLIDPAGNYNEPLEKDQWVTLYPEFDCPPVARKIRALKTFHRELELVPNATYFGYIVFPVDEVKVAGTWKLSMYDIPVEMDTAGNVTKTTAFEKRFGVRLFREIWLDPVFGPDELIRVQEVQ